MIDMEAFEKLCKVTAIFFLGFHKSPVCYPVSSTQRNEFISAAAKSVGKMSKQHTMLALPDSQVWVRTVLSVSAPMGSAPVA